MFAFDIELTFESEDSILSATFALSTASEYFSRMSLSFSLSHEFKSSFDYNIFIFFFFFFFFASKFLCANLSLLLLSLPLQIDRLIRSYGGTDRYSIRKENVILKAAKRREYIEIAR